MVMNRPGTWVGDGYLGCLNRLTGSGRYKRQLPCDPGGGPLLSFLGQETRDDPPGKAGPPPQASRYFPERALAGIT